MADFLSFASSNETFYPIVLKIVNNGDENINEDIFMDYLETIKNTNKKKTMKIAEIKKGCV